LQVIVVLEDIRIFNNVGSVFRTADAFAIEKIILTGISPRPPHREIRKTALGASESVNWTYEHSCIETIKKYKKLGYKTYAIEQTSDSIALNDFAYNKELIVLVFGNEVSGVSQDVIDICDFSLEIPQFGTKHSLNISVSCGVVLWHLVK
jgi:tRNA G18 (ribose-2'-O)-methylase SpoU